MKKETLLFLLKARCRIRKRILLVTWYPGCNIVIGKRDSEWDVSVSNDDPSKIPTEAIHRYTRDFLNRHLDPRKSVIARGDAVDFSESFLCLENWRDICEGRITELIDDDRSYAKSKIGAFGFLKGKTKPARLEYIELCKRHPEKFEYIETGKYAPDTKDGFITLNDYKNTYKYLIDLPGHTYSTKIYWMLFTRRLIFFVPPTTDFKWESRLVPFEHYVPVRPDLADLVERFEWAEANPDQAEAIVKNAFELGRTELSPEAMIGKLAEAIRPSLRAV